MNDTPKTTECYMCGAWESPESAEQLNRTDIPHASWTWPPRVI